MTDIPPPVTLEDVLAELRDTKAQVVVLSQGTSDLNNTISTVFAPKLETVERRVDEQAKEIVPRSEHRRNLKKGLAVAAVVVVVISAAVWKVNGYTAANARNTKAVAMQAKTLAAQQAAIASEQRRADLEVCYTVVVDRTDLRGLLDQFVKGAQSTVQRADASPSATAQVKALAAQSLAETQVFVTQAEQALAIPDCTLLPKP